MSKTPSPSSLRAALAFLLMSACAPGGGGDGSLTDSGSPATRSDTGERVATTGPTGAATGEGVAGRLVDPGGVPLAYTDILCCTTVTCVKDETGADGTFAFSMDPGTPAAIKTHAEMYRTPRWAAALAPALFADGQLLELGDLAIMALPAGTPLGPVADDPQTLAAGDGLELTLRRADLTPDIGVFLHDVAATLIPQGQRPSYAALGGAEVVAAYALHPFATTSASPVGVAVPCDLPAGTAVQFQSVSHIDGTLSEPATGRADGTVARTDPGQGVTLLTHLVVSVAP